MSASIPLPIEPRMKWLLNNQRCADVTFVVGEDKEIVYAHKTMIALGSPVFEQMFFANHDLQMTGSEPIGIPDLTGAGFFNMLKYIYTNDLKDLDLSELFETFMAGDKYQVYSMNETMFSLIKARLDASNCCIIYDQLMKFPSEYVCVPLDQVKAIIRYNSEAAFKSEHFVNISQETLVDLLRMDALTVDEMDVLKSCTKWVDEEINRLNLEPNAANKQEIFKPIKNLIGFSKITFDQLKNFSPIGDLLSSDEVKSLFLHHLQVSKFIIECEAPRIKLVLQSACCSRKQSNFWDENDFVNFSEFNPVFKASRVIFIEKIYTFLPKKIKDLQLLLNDNASGQKVELNYEKLSDGDNCWHFRFVDAVKIDPEKDYTFSFQFRTFGMYCYRLSTDTTMYVDTPFSSLQCSLSSLSFGYHCLKKIDFYEVF